MSSALDAALFYLERGWSVFPISPASKKPYKGFEWAEYQRRLPTTAEVRQWWEETPHAGVAIVTGKLSGLVVLDVDTKRGADAAPIFQRFPSPLVVRTPSGGYHFYYQYPDGEAIGNHATKAGYDLRAEGGYVLAPPTLHPAGIRYNWFKKITERTAPADMRPGVLELVQSPPTKGPGSTEPWLAEILEGVTEGSRNDACARLCGYWLSKKIAPDVVLGMLRNWDQQNTPPLGSAVLERTLDSVQKTRQRALSAETKTPPAPELADQPGDLLRLLTLHQYMSLYGDHDVQWAVEAWLPHETIAMVTSPPGTYKTWTLLDLAISVATGTPFLGRFKVQQPGPVMLFQQEDFHGQIAQRLGVIMQGRFAMGWEGDDDGDTMTLTLPPSPPVYIHPDRELRFDDVEVMDMLEARIDALRPTLVIIDPLYTAADMKDYMAGAVKDMMRLKALRDRYHCSFLLAHHTSKRSEKTEREDAWGSQFLNAFIETGWQVRPRAQGSAIIRRHFKVSKDAEENILHFDIQTEKMPYLYETDVSKMDESDTLDARIVALLSTDRLTMSGVARALKADKSTISRHVKNLLAQRVLRLGSNNLLRAPPSFHVEDTAAMAEPPRRRKRET